MKKNKDGILLSNTSENKLQITYVNYQFTRKVISAFGLAILLALTFSVSDLAAATKSSATFAELTPDKKQDEYPGRQLYPETAYIEMAEFHEKLAHEQILLIDVRSKFEFETLHIKKAINIPIASHDFIKRIKKLRETDDRPIVTYCNGKTCMKSYKAAKKMGQNHIDNVLAFDSGVMDYARAYPNEALLLGKTLKNSKHLISQTMFSKHTLKPENFTKQIASTNAILLDIRDRVQRDDGISLFAGREHRVTLDSTRRLNRYIEEAKKNNQGLLIYDASGKQVRWLQYRLEQSGVKDYIFMAGGATAYYQYLESK